MKQSTLFAIIAFLLGISLFGIYKSVALIHKNAHLEDVLGSVRLQLQEADSLWRKTQKLLDETRYENEILEGEFKLLQKEFASQEKNLKAQQERVAELSLAVREIADSHNTLEAENKEMTDQFLRLSLENKELRKKLSSVQTLQQAIKDLRRKTAKEKKVKEKKNTLVEKKKKQLALNHKKKSLKALGPGNKGYMTKNGKPTHEAAAVDITVIPAEEVEVRR